MGRFVWIVLLVVVLVISGVAAQQPARPASPRAAASSQLPFTPLASIKDLMESLIDPQADLLFNAVATTVSAAGTEEKAPKTDAEWEAVRKGALLVIEGGNMLMVPGRRAAREGTKSETPGVELEPEEMDALIKKDHGRFVQRAQSLVNSAIVALRAIDAKNPRALSDASGALDAACENCHLDFWYPSQPAQLKQIEERDRKIFK